MMKIGRNDSCPCDSWIINENGSVPVPRGI